MRTFSHKTTGALAALVLAAGAGLALAAPARADTVRNDCDGNTCVRTYCDDDGYCTHRTTVRDAYIDTSQYRRLRYACDIDGNDCHWTRSYYLDADGNAVYDPDVNNYP
jgi:uncharacterized protein (DUF2147 family)